MIKVSSILIGVKDLNISKSFYENILGREFIEFRPPYSLAVQSGIEFNIEEDAEYRNKDWAQIYIGGRKQVAFEVSDLEAFINDLKINNIKIIQGIEVKQWGWKEAIIADIDGNEFIIEQKSN